jgi:hypothetical protein
MEQIRCSAYTSRFLYSTITMVSQSCLKPGYACCVYYSSIFSLPLARIISSIQYLKILYFSYRNGVRLCSLVLPSETGLLYQPQITDQYKAMVKCWVAGENRGTCFSPTFSTINLVKLHRIDPKTAWWKASVLSVWATARPERSSVHVYRILMTAYLLSGILCLYLYKSRYWQWLVKLLYCYITYK